MKTVPSLFAAALAFGFAAPVMADHHEEEAPPKAEVVERDEDGRATKVSVEGVVYDVCSEGQTDNCINPREAGLDFGDVPLDYWPGQPASEMDEDG